ncbi:S41 family peptidase [Polyangium sp. y55x31]|uniref:S41 family peptidase n=1 Tax=Polyangium sp. y55x31 TaxID=3042688 RepID=UPI0024827F64|nr:S41 family peptidase [Polyangium sp. y55x31]MDI1477888.1 S41 family peptidase [Polyangium sp. y55x31]
MGKIRALDLVPRRMFLRAPIALRLVLPFVLLACGNVPPPEPMPAPLPKPEAALPGAEAAAAPRVDPSRALEGRALENVVAFTQLYNYVRFFHPSDEAARADWNAIAVDGARRVEGATSAEELAQILGEIFGPVAPTLRVFPTGLRQDLPEAILPPKDGSKPKIVAWQHEGIELGMLPNNVYKSQRVNDMEASPLEPGGIDTSLPIEKCAGKKVVVSAFARVESPGEQGGAQIGIGVKGAQKKYDWTTSTPARPREWTKITHTVDVPADAKGVDIGFEIDGAGKAFFDDVVVEVQEGGKTTALKIKNPGFEKVEKDEITAWNVPSPEQAKALGIGAATTTEAPKSGKRAVVVTATPKPPPKLALPSEVYEAELGGGVSCKLPLTLYADDRGTLPHGTAAPAEPPPSGVSATFAYSLKDRETRLAGITMAWGIMQHFYPYFDVVGTDWTAVLRKSLSKAATAIDEQGAVLALELLVTQLHDGHGNVVRMVRTPEGQPVPEMATRGYLPMNFTWAEGQLVVTNVHPSAGAEVRPGDTVIAIGDKPIDAWMAAIEPRIPAATPGWRKRVATSHLRMGTKGEPVKVTLKHEGGNPVTVELAYSLGMMEKLPQEKRPEPVAEVALGISYVDLDRVTPEQFEAALPRLAKAKGVIFDLRGYPKVEPGVLGHLTSKPLASPDWKMPRIVRPNREGLTFEVVKWIVEPKAPRIQGKIVFLTDERAISQAETWMSMVDHYKLGKIVGATTAGTNGNVNPFPVPGGVVITWTGLRVERFDGSRFHGVGVPPNIPATRTVKGIREGRDEVLEVGIGVVTGKVK